MIFVGFMVNRTQGNDFQSQDLCSDDVSRFRYKDPKRRNIPCRLFLAFAGFVRMGEFTWCEADRREELRQWHLTRSSVTFKNDRLHVQLPASKTDPFRQGVEITTAATGDEACTLNSLRNLFQKFPTSLHAPLFDTAKGFPRKYVTTVFKTCHTAWDIHVTIRDTLRRGAATSASEGGLSEDDIMTLGRGKSDSYNRLYIQANPDKTMRGISKTTTLKRQVIDL